MQKRHFSFIGGDPAIDFLNTLVMREGIEIDLLDRPDALDQWLAAAKLHATHASAASLRGIRALRAALRRIAFAVTAGGAAAARDLQVIDRELRRGEGRLTLENDLAFTFRPRGKAVDPRFAVARLIAEFLSHMDPDRLRACGGARCILFFYDTSKSGTRRWCAMSGCGNRAKAAQHYRRARK